MARTNLNDLMAFAAVAREGNFTRAAAKLGVSQSALSQTIGQLEARLGLRLFTRTTRSVSLTEAGQRLSGTVTPRLEEIDAELAALSSRSGQPVGSIRISTAEHAAGMVLWPRLDSFLPRYPDIKIEIAINYSLIDIVAERFDAGVRLGQQVAKDMVAVRIGPDFRMAVVATPEYFARHAAPRTPHDLATHNCINLRLPTYGGLYAWEFAKGKRQLNVRVDGQLTLSASVPILRAALGGFGLAFLPEDMVAEHVAAGRLVEVLKEWCPSFPGYYLYYPNRRQHSTAFATLVEHLRYRA